MTGLIVGRNLHGLDAMPGFPLHRCPQAIDFEKPQLFDEAVYRRPRFQMHDQK